MPKINREEYKVLKELDDKWKWIARIEEGAMKTFISKPFKNMDFGRSGSWDIKGNENHAIYTTYSDLFQFIQWEDDEPYDIQELIKEYEFGKILLAMAEEETVLELEYESEETEVKKNKKWFVDKWTKERNKTDVHDPMYHFINEFIADVNQLDEPEVLSQEWIDENEEQEEMYGSYGVPVHKPQNLLVPKQELPVIPKFVAEWIESRDYYNVYKVLQDLSAPGSPHASKDVRNWIFRNQENVEKFVRAWLDGFIVEEEEQKYQVIIRDGEYMWLYLCKHDGNVTIGTNNNYFEKYPEVTYLTEQEIKDYDERYWAFAVKVEELEE